MGFFDFVKKAGAAIGEAAADYVSSPDFGYRLGYDAGRNGEKRSAPILPRDDGSPGWQKNKAIYDAYNRGYDDGREERRSRFDDR